LWIVAFSLAPTILPLPGENALPPDPPPSFPPMLKGTSAAPIPSLTCKMQEQSDPPPDTPSLFPVHRCSSERQEIPLRKPLPFWQCCGPDSHFRRTFFSPLCDEDLLRRRNSLSQGVLSLQIYRFPSHNDLLPRPSAPKNVEIVSFFPSFFLLGLPPVSPRLEKISVSRVSPSYRTRALVMTGRALFRPASSDPGAKFVGYRSLFPSSSSPAVFPSSCAKNAESPLPPSLPL